MKQQFEQRAVSNTTTLGERLQQARKDKHIDIERVAKDIQIRAEYIQAIEDSNYTALPSTVFVKNYVRKYAQYLRFDKALTEELLTEELAVYTPDPDIPTLQGHLTKPPLKVVNVLAIVTVLLAALVIITYFSFEISNIIQPPELTIEELPARASLDERFVTITGQTAPEATVFINDQLVAVKEDGSFAQLVTLQTGVNVFKVVAKTKRSREHTEYRQIVLEESNN